MSKIIVNDGCYRWGADRAELEAAMRALGWEQEGRYWVEPKEDEPGEQYARLCNLVQPLPDMAEGAWDDMPMLRWVPHVSRRHWRVDG